MIELRTAASASTSGRTVSGHAIVYNKPTVISGAFIEQIAAGAVAETIRDDDIRALYNHNADYVLVDQI